MNEVWNIEVSAWEDLPTVSDLMRAADKKLLAREVVGMYVADGRKPSKKRLKRARKSMRRVIKEMRDIAPNKSDEWILTPKHACNVTNDFMPKGYFADACALRRGDLDELAQRESVTECKRGELNGYSYMHERWADVLGYRVWLVGEWSCRERYLFLADILWEMTFWGETEKEHDKNAAADLKEIEEATTELEAEIEAAGGIEKLVATGLPPLHELIDCDESKISLRERYEREYEDATRKLDGKIVGLFDEELLESIKALARKLKGERCSI